MLLLDRKKGQSVIIEIPDGRLIRITVIADTELGVKLGFDADKDIKINREEKLLNEASRQTDSDN